MANYCPRYVDFEGGRGEGIKQINGPLKIRQIDCLSTAVDIKYIL